MSDTQVSVTISNDARDAVSDMNVTFTPHPERTNPPQRPDSPQQSDYGETRHYQDNKLHCDDGPAYIMPPGTFGDTPGTLSWYRNDKRDRVDGPANVTFGRRTSYSMDACAVTVEHWYRDDLLHRDNGPAAVTPHTLQWWTHGNLDRIMWHNLPASFPPELVDAFQNPHVGNVHLIEQYMEARASGTWVGGTLNERFVGNGREIVDVNTLLRHTIESAREAS